MIYNTYVTVYLSNMFSSLYMWQIVLSVFLKGQCNSVHGERDLTTLFFLTVPLDSLKNVAITVKQLLKYNCIYLEHSLHVINWLLLEHLIILLGLFCYLIVSIPGREWEWQEVSESDRTWVRVTGSEWECQEVSESARKCKRMPGSGGECQEVRESDRKCKRVPGSEGESQ